MNPAPGLQPSPRTPPNSACRLARVAARQKLGSMFVLRLRAPGWPGGAPGQFALLRHEASARFLPRAFSLHAQQGELVSFLIAPIGPGTEELAEAAVGEGVHVLGPLGHGFDLTEILAGTPRRLVVVGGGVGVAPFRLLLDRLTTHAAATLPEVVVLFGFRDDVQAECLAAFEPAVDRLRARGAAVELETICEDGSLGRAGLVTTLLQEAGLRAGDAVLACGAHAMCQAVWDLGLAAGGVRAWFSLEAGMACGVGSCHGCVIRLTDGSLAKVCRRGPVFGAGEVFGESRHPCAVPGGDR